MDEFIILYIYLPVANEYVIAHVMPLATLTSNGSMMAPTSGASTFPMISIRWTTDSFPWPCSLCADFMAILYSGRASLSVDWICCTFPADSVDCTADSDAADVGTSGRANVHPVNANTISKVHLILMDFCTKISIISRLVFKYRYIIILLLLL